MMTSIEEKEEIDFNKWADFWRYDIGVNVIPADTRHKTTHISWAQYQDSPISEEQHKIWKNMGQFGHGMAIIMGKVFHNESKKGLYLYCIDCDNKKAKDVLINDWDYIINNTLIEWHDDDPDKIHFYGYSHLPLPKKSSDIRNNLMKEKMADNEFPAFEVKGKGKDGIMFCSPSVHRNGSRYRVGPCKEPKVTDGIEQKINSICQSFGIPYLVGAKSLSDYKIPIEKLVSDDNYKILEGHNRHEAVLRIAEHYVATIPNLNDDALFTLVNSRNNIVCTPPLSDGEIHSICRQAINYVEKTIGRPDENSNKKNNKSKIDHNIIAQRIIDERDLVTLTKTHDILYYSNGVYEYGAEEIISQECRVLSPEIRNHDIVEILGIIRDKTGYHRVGEFDDDIYRINVQNGFVNLKTGRLEDHHPKYLSRVQLPVTYNPESQAQNFTRYLKSCHEKDPETIYTVLEMMAICLIRDNHRFEIAYMLTGRGSNGKSVLLQILQAILGDKNCSNKSIHDLESQRFSISGLDGRLANICADIAPNELKSTGNLKKLISGDYMDGEQKYKDSYSFRNFAKLIFSANQIPEVFDESDAFARRFFIIDWKKSFYGEERQEYVQKISTDVDELSGIFNIMIRFAINLLKHGVRFQKSVRDAKMQWMEKSDSVKNFVERECVLDVEHSIGRQRLYSQYIKFCKSKQISILSTKQFNKKIEDLGIDKKSTRQDGENVYLWTGITLMSELSGGNQRLDV